MRPRTYSSSSRHTGIPLNITSDCTSNSGESHFGKAVRIGQSVTPKYRVSLRKVFLDPFVELRNGTFAPRVRLVLESRAALVLECWLQLNWSNCCTSIRNRTEVHTSAMPTARMPVYGFLRHSKLISLPDRLKWPRRQSQPRIRRLVTQQKFAPRSRITPPMFPDVLASTARLPGKLPQ